MYRIEILTIDSKYMTFRILDRMGSESASRTRITLVQSLPKQDKMSTVLRMCTELGCQEFVPILTQYSDFK